MSITNQQTSRTTASWSLSSIPVDVWKSIIPKVESMHSILELMKCSKSMHEKINSVVLNHSIYFEQRWLDEAVDFYRRSGIVYNRSIKKHIERDEYLAKIFRDCAQWQILFSNPIHQSNLANLAKYFYLLCQWAMKKELPDVLQLIIDDKRGEIDTRIQLYPIQDAIELKCRFGVELLLKDERMFPWSKGRANLLKMAVREGDLTILKLLLADERLVCCFDASFSLSICDTFDIEILSELVKCKGFQNIILIVINSAIWRGNYDALRMLLLDRERSSTEQLEMADTACRAFPNNKVIYFLWKNDYLDKLYNGHGNMLEIACVYSHVEIVKMCLSTNKMHPAIDMSEAFIRACGGFKGGEVVKFLLADDRFNPAAQDNRALATACRCNIPEVVKMLLGDKRVDPSANNSVAFVVACRARNVNVVKLLLDDDRIDPNAFLPSVATDSIFWWDTDMVNMLLNHQKFDPSANNNLLFINACAMQQMDIVKRLLQDKRVNSCDQNHRAFFLACSNNNLELVKLLLTDERMDYLEIWEDATCEAQITNNGNEVLDYLDIYHDICMKARKRSKRKIQKTASTMTTRKKLQKK